MTRSSKMYQAGGRPSCRSKPQAGIRREAEVTGVKITVLPRRVVCCRVVLGGQDAL